MVTTETEMSVFGQAQEQWNVLHEAERIIEAEFERMNASPMKFVDVTLRDGLQQKDIKQGEIGPDGKPEGLSISERLDIFDLLVEAGMTEIEVGHFGNAKDQPFGRALVKHIEGKTAAGDDRYAQVKLQVLFGADGKQIEDGIKVLEGLDKDRVIVHVYNRISPGLRSFAKQQPNTPEASAQGVCDAVDIPLAAGFKYYSVSGEGAVDHNQRPEVVADYYNTVSHYLFDCGAIYVNVNLANTFGTGAKGRWDQEGLRTFDESVKSAAYNRPGCTVETSVHCHNDTGNAVSFSMAAIEAGFDKIEGTINGMGERYGNTAIVDVLVDMADTALADCENIGLEIREYEVPEDMFSMRALKGSIFAKRRLEKTVAANLHNMHRVAQKIGEIAETKRYEETGLGKRRAYDAGSGPHCEANVKYVESPIQRRLLDSYLRIAIMHAMLGRPDARAIIEVDMEVLKEITVNNHAGGGNTMRMINEDVVRAPQDEIDTHISIVEARQRLMTNYMAQDMAVAK